MYRSRQRRSRLNGSRSTARHWRLAGVAAVAVAVVGAGLGVASAAEDTPTVNCPQVALNGLVPLQANDEVRSNLELLNKQIDEANARLASSVGQGGPNFIQNAILGPLKDKRFATINRMETAIGRNAAKPDLDAEGRATCNLNANGGESVKNSTSFNVARQGQNAAADAPTVNCQNVSIRSAVPLQAQGEVDSNLELLDKQIEEANARLASSVGEGGPNFIQNAILGPLKDKRLATINRIETAIGRTGDKPDLDAEGRATCTLNQNGGGGAAETAAVAAPPAAPQQQAKVDGPGANLGVLSNSCDASQQPAHDGFQKGDRCVSTQFGEVGLAFSNPSLLITDAPQQVGVNQGFSIRVSTRNLLRDRFLAAGQGGYYVESSILQGGIVRGHFHTACRMLGGTDVAPAPEPVPAFFVATEDGKGSRAPDQVTIEVPGIPAAGTLQCAAWAGDGSHRIPMMERANQTPAFDAVRIQVG